MSICQPVVNVLRRWWLRPSAGAFDWAFGRPSVAPGAVALGSGAVCPVGVAVVGAGVGASGSCSCTVGVCGCPAGSVACQKPTWRHLLELVPGHCRDVGRHHRWRDDWRGSVCRRRGPCRLLRPRGRWR